MVKSPLLIVVCSFLLAGFSIFAGVNHAYGVIFYPITIQRDLLGSVANVSGPPAFYSKSLGYDGTLYIWRYNIPADVLSRLRHQCSTEKFFGYANSCVIRSDRHGGRMRSIGIVNDQLQMRMSYN